MIRLVITKTSKVAGTKDRPQIYDQTSKNFRDVSEAKKYLKEEYGKASRQKMYADTKDGKTIQTGYVYKYKDKDFDRDRNKYVHFVGNDWIEFQEVRSMDLSSKKLKGVI
jgi:hypothetical protein